MHQAPKRLSQGQPPQLLEPLAPVWWELGLQQTAPV